MKFSLGKHHSFPSYGQGAPIKKIAIQINNQDIVIAIKI